MRRGNRNQRGIGPAFRSRRLHAVHGVALASEAAAGWSRGCYTMTDALDSNLGAALDLSSTFAHFIARSGAARSPITCARPMRLASPSLACHNVPAEGVMPLGPAQRAESPGTGR
jgi:hypothetical protein